ncbi:MAG: 2OG-Fe(II) oxygenase [Planctomycetota bacterium]|nr:2OG-Fe(II) oxygenase [Planctomycetota bacterium]
MTDTSLHPRLRDPAALAALARDYRASGGNLRVAGVLAPGLAEALPDLLLSLPFSAHHVQDDHVRCFFWRCVIAVPPEGPGALPSPLDLLGRFVTQDLPALASAISGRAVRGPVEDVLPACLYRKGSYLDAHEDHGVDRAVAFVLGLTRGAWPAEAGGHLEFLAEDRETVVERRPPGFDTLDLYDVRPVVRWHRVPLLLEHVERLTVSGWLPSSPEATTC